jgi:hypothetical protein
LGFNFSVYPDTCGILITLKVGRQHLKDYQHHQGSLGESSPDISVDRLLLEKSPGIYFIFRAASTEMSLPHFCSKRVGGRYQYKTLKKWGKKLPFVYSVIGFMLRKKTTTSPYIL